MRLIDTEKIEIPASMIYRISGCYMIRVEDVQRIISDQPVAFDKEKVMSEIKEYKEDSEEWAKKPVENADEFYTYADAYKRCLEIVEKGGVE